VSQVQAETKNAALPFLVPSRWAADLGLLPKKCIQPWEAGGGEKKKPTQHNGRRKVARTSTWSLLRAQGKKSENGEEARKKHKDLLEAGRRRKEGHWNGAK